MPQLFKTKNLTHIIEEAEAQEHKLKRSPGPVDFVSWADYFCQLMKGFNIVVLVTVVFVVGINESSFMHNIFVKYRNFDPAV